MIRLPKILKPQRRWLQFRIRTMLCVMVVVAVICGWPRTRRQHALWRLEEYVGVDLKDLPQDEKRRVRDWIDILLGSKANERFPWSCETWLVHTLNVPGKGRRMYVIQMEPTMCIPGASYCELHIIDRRGDPVRSMRFNVGYRAWPQTARFEKSRHGFWCLTVETHGMWSGETRQFYRVTDNHVELLRSERLDGTMEMGSGNLFEIHDKPSDRPPWERLVASDDPVAQLRGLAAFWSYENQERLGPIDEKTRIRLKHLSKSRDAWISEESAAALQFLAAARHHRGGQAAPGTQAIIGNAEVNKMGL